MPDVRPKIFRFLAHWLAALGRSAAASGGNRHIKDEAMRDDEREKNAAVLPVSIGSAPWQASQNLTLKSVVAKPDRTIKIPGVSPRWLPRALSCSCLSVYRCHSAVMAAFSHSTPDTQVRVGSSLQAGLYARTPVQSDYHALFGNYRLESNPKRHDKSPLAVAIGRGCTRDYWCRVLEVRARLRLN